MFVFVILSMDSMLIDKAPRKIIRLHYDNHNFPHRYIILCIFSDHLCHLYIPFYFLANENLNLCSLLNIVGLSI